MTVEDEKKPLVSLISILRIGEILRKGGDQMNGIEKTVL